ncbi:hypothetical protein DWQ65_00915 [Treponema phagedenis]|uniref:Uncharacterized protein n=1 Tax=Treponema phagedenis TaxID=162 RepID=A0A0B7GW31_TREPH|nr:hypothetical protein [Treponema phagedenis]NVP25202.1 hypothetical protein [Treponema phagedenis]QEJ95936.1 hypothetical protein FUT79_12485 [Treponema phagedenis]QEJ97320.1 hypothetical protein FUT82_04485 [Treponema phagedenis]QEK00365.1 hypothetical protein FUT84_03685 [Treponema phagedenis]QEK02486.1 hypothetical protein FUT83_00835 [Treponema phagedenis]
MEYFLIVAITSAISLGMVLLSRQMDKNNRSIEKAKKYGDRVREELEAFVTEKTNQLRNAGIELSVQQEQALASVKRLDDIYDKFMQQADKLAVRSATIESIDQHAKNSEQTIKQLMELTSVAQKNLTEITKESGFIDSLGKAIHDSKAELQQIIDALPEVQNTFRAENAQNLADAKKDIFAEITEGISELEKRLTDTERKSESLFEVAAIKLNELYKKALEDAAKKAENFEDEAFKKLESQTIERIKKYKNTLEERSAVLDQQIKTNLADTKKLAAEFKQGWTEEAKSYVSVMKTDFAEIESKVDAKVQNLLEKISNAENKSTEHSVQIQNTFKHTETGLKEKIQTLAATLNENIQTLSTASHEKLQTISTTLNESLTKLSQSSNVKFINYQKEVEFRYNKIEQAIAGIDTLEEELKKLSTETEEKFKQSFNDYVRIAEEKQTGFEANFTERYNTLITKMEEINNELNELKNTAYANASEKLKLFQDDFFEDLQKRGDVLNIRIDEWRNDLEEKLTLLASENESSRRDIEDAYKKELKQRLLKLAEENNGQFLKLSQQVSQIEENLKRRISGNDQSLEQYITELKNTAETLKEKASISLEEEVLDMQQKMQETLKTQTRDLEANAKELSEYIENIKTQAEQNFAEIHQNLESWKTGSDRQFADARSLFDGKISSFAALTETAIENLDAKYNSQYKEFALKSDEAFEELNKKFEEMDEMIANVKNNLTNHAESVTATLQNDCEQASQLIDKKIREATFETESSLQTVRDMIQSLQTQIVSTQEGLLTKIQNDSERLTQSLDEIEKRQAAFINQTKVFERADELKAGLEEDITRITNEIAKFEIYRDTMDKLSLQYEKVKHLEEEAEQKIARFMEERKNIDILEGEFAKLEGFSESMDRKILEINAVNDDLQQYQVQIRKIEESISDVNTRYDRLEKKGLVLDQTVKNIDDAFENLKALENNIKDFKGELTTVSPELESVRNDLTVVLENQNKTEAVRAQMETIDSLLEEMEERIEKMQNAREWLAATETRLQEISKNSESQLKLLGVLLKSEMPAKTAGSGSPSIETRENVLKLYNSGWTIEAIANALKRSEGEIGLILEMADK